MSRSIDADALMETLKIMRDKNKAEQDDSIETSLIVIGIQEAYWSAIEAVQDAPTIGGWVSVKNRLPKDGQDVLAYLYNGEETRIAPFNYDKGTWYDCVMNCTVAINSITHWMPLPEPPKEVNE